MSEDPATTLQEWALAGQLNEASLNEAGTELNKDGISLPADSKITVSFADKNCDYTLASVYLQIVNPAQGLKDYRTACKKYNVKDPVKASDKTTVVGFFLGSAANEAAAAVAAAAVAPEAAPPVPEAAAPAAAEATAAAVATSSDKHKSSSSSSRDRATRDKDREKDRRSSSSKDKDKHRSSSSREKDKEKYRQDKKRSHSSSSRHSEEKKKKAPKTINTETLFSNLVTVVDKRSHTKIDETKREETALLMAALSTDGFEVTPDLLSKHRQTTEAIVANEIPVGNSASILKAAAGKDLSRILKMYLEVMQPKSSGSSSGANGKLSANISSTATLGQKKTWRAHLVGKKPVIIVPKGMTAPITLINAHEFFGNSRYVPRDVMMKKGMHKTNIPTNFSRRVAQRLGGGTVEYEIMDNPKSKLVTANDWDRVVAVLCLGHAWQFKDWPGFYSSPVRLFSHVFGFCVLMEGDKLPGEVNSWAVTQARLNRDKRGMDSVTHASFWNGVDEYMAIHKPEMLPQPEG